MINPYDKNEKHKKHSRNPIGEKRKLEKAKIIWKTRKRNEINGEWKEQYNNNWTVQSQ